jgi:hypothetical protein
MPGMTVMHRSLLAEIDAFLGQSGMGESYFGKAAAGNSELVSRLRAGGRVWPETEQKVRSFIKSRRAASPSVDPDGFSPVSDKCEPAKHLSTPRDRGAA